jgi:uncharacterized protein (DUF2336 family)
MIKPLPALVGLEDLSGHRDGIDVRPTLLRVLTDLYLQRPTHTPEDERYYTELALRLIDANDISQRAALAKRLARYPSAPRQVIERLARDTIEVAAPILEHSPTLAADDLRAIAQECGGIHAQIIAGRIADQPPAPSPGGLAAAASFQEQACELTELFYAAGAAERRLILINLDYASLAPSPLLAAIERTDVWRLETAALQHNSAAMARELERILGISRSQAHRLLEDELGEPVVVVAKAMNLPGEVLQRMLLFMNPRAGHWVGRVLELDDLFLEISTDAARRLITIWRAAAAVEHQCPPQVTDARQQSQSTIACTCGDAIASARA